MDETIYCYIGMIYVCYTMYDHKIDKNNYEKSQKDRCQTTIMDGQAEAATDK